jgi:Phosphate-induced protein 1 conserved region
MSQKIQAVSLFAVFALAACSESPVDASQALNPVFGPKSVTASTELPPLTLSELEIAKPLQIDSAYDNGGILSRDNAPAKMGDDRPEHIKYWGGKLIMQQRVAAIYYGPNPIYNNGPAVGTTGTAAQDQSLVGFYLSNTGSSARWNVNTTYSQTIDKVESFVQPSMTYTGFWATNVGSLGSSVSQGNMVQIIETGFASGKLTYDPSTLYVIFTGPGVNLGGGFSKSNLQYCAFHSAYIRANHTTVQISAMPYDADFAPGHLADGGFLCVPQTGSPNSDFGADGIVSALQHETEETTTDPYMNGFRGWFDIHGFESSDKCAYIYGPVLRNATGAYNITVGSKPFLVQGQWQRAASTPERCATSL